MPGVPTAIGLILAFKVAGDITVGAILASAIISTSLSFALAALAPGIKTTLSSSLVNSFRTITRASNSPSRVIYGKMEVGGVLDLAISTTNTGNEKAGVRFLHVVLAVCEGPIASIDYVTLNNVDVGHEELRTRVTVIKMLGSLNQPPMGHTAMVGGESVTLPTRDHLGKVVWSDQHRLRGVAYIWAIMKYDPRVFPGGAPAILMRVTGRLVYDPRDGATRWSNNWVLVALDYMTSARYGMRMDLSRFDLAFISAEANYCDELVDGEPIFADADVANGNTGAKPIGYKQQKRYAVSGIFETTEDPINVLTSILAAANGGLVRHGGLWRIRSGRPFDSNPASPTYDGDIINMTDSDLRGPIQILPQSGRKDRINTIRGTFINAENHWQADSYPEVSLPILVREDGDIKLEKTVDFPFLDDAYRAQRVARQLLLRSRRPNHVQFKCLPTMTAAFPTGIISFTSETLGGAATGWANKLFEVLEWTYNTDGGIDLDCIEYRASDYTWTGADGSRPPTQPSDGYSPNPFDTPDPVTSVSSTEEVETQPDGTTVSVLHISWNYSTDTDIDRFRVSYRLVDSPAGAGTGTWIIASTAQKDIRLRGMSIGSYEIEIVAIGLNGNESRAVSARTSISFTSGPPPDITDLFFEYDIATGMRRFEWVLDGSEPADLAFYVLRYLPDPTSVLGVDPNTEWESAQYLLATRDTAVGIFKPALPGEYVIYGRAVDRSGNWSTNTTTLRITIPTVRTRQIIAKEEAFTMGWPGQINGGAIDGVGRLNSTGAQSWIDLGTWSSAPVWGDTFHPLTYIHTPIDLGRDRDVLQPITDIIMQSGTSQIYVRGRSENGEFGRFHPLISMSSVRYVQFMIVAHPATTDPKIAVVSRFAMALVDNTKTEVISDLDTATINSAIEQVERRERYAQDLEAGTHYNTRIIRSDDLGTVQADNDSAIHFDGTTGFATAADAADLRLTTGFTIELTLRPDVLLQSGKSLLAKGSAWEITYNNGTVAFVSTSFTGDDPATGASMAVPVGGFMPASVAFSYNAETRIWAGYLNGNPSWRKARSFALVDVGAAVTIGHRTGSDYFDGVIEGIRLWNYGRSRAEVAADAHAIVAAATGLVANWRADDATGATITDRSGGGHNATLSGGYDWVRFAARMSPPLDLGVVRKLRRSKIRWSDAGVAATSLTVEASIDNLTWTALANRGDLPFFTEGDDLSGQTLYLRQLLWSTDPTVSHSLSGIDVILRTIPAVGDVIVHPRGEFDEITSAVVTAVQGGAAVAEVIGKMRGAVRIRLTDPATGALKDATVDVLLRGGFAAA